MFSYRWKGFFNVGIHPPSRPLRQSFIAVQIVTHICILGTIENSEACEGNDEDACKVNIENGYKAFDGDNDVIIYSINPTGANAVSFKIMDETNLDSIYYLDGIKEQTTVQLLIEVKLYWKLCGPFNSK